MNKRPRLPLVAITKSVKLERERLNSLINSMGDGVIAIDENLKIIVCNGAMLNILDSNSSIDGKSIVDVLHIINEGDRKLDLRQFISEVKTPYTTREWKLLYPNDEKINLYTSIAPVRLGYGQRGQKGHVILLRDITKEKSLEEERDEFIGVISHELRTPVAIAEGNISNARFIFEKSGIKNIPMDEALRESHLQLNFLSAMINDLSMLSRAEGGDLTMKIEPINVPDLIHELSKSYISQAQSKGLVMNTEIDPSLEILKSSKLYIREILQNFITNAIKYTQTGHVILGAKVNKIGVDFYVIDTGIGISKSDKEKIFGKFFRVENFKTRETSGTGLGLYVATKLARLLHAKVTLDSEPNKGSVFTITVPNAE